MKKLLLFVLITMTAMSFSSCKKDKTETTTEKVQHKWTLVSVVDNYHDSSGDDITTTPGSTGDYITFNSNGTVTTVVSGATESGNYSITSDTQITIEGDIYTIKKLTGSEFVLYSKTDISSTEYEEVTINLKR